MGYVDFEGTPQEKVFRIKSIRSLFPQSAHTEYQL